MTLHEEILQLLPTLQQKLSILALGLAGMALIVWLVSTRRMREEHALLWFLGLAGGLVLVWVDPLLANLSLALGINLPAHALILVAVLFLFALSIWLTSTASRNKHRIENLVIHLSLLTAQVQELQTALAEQRKNH